MFLEIHLIQNFALSNLNRDDTGAPKSCIFAGTRRSRISSQCLKRSVRTSVRENGMIPSEQLAYRTKKIVVLLATRLMKSGVDADQAKLVAQNAIEGINLKLKNDKTEYLLMVGDREVDQLTKVCQENIEKLNRPRDESKTDKKEKSNDKVLSKQLLDALDGGDAVDMALFGRMIATYPEKNIDAAVQMAHALSTNAITNEFDYYSAVDDLQKDTDDSGAGAAMIGTMLYNSPCYYRYANLDMTQLINNLSNDKVLAIQAMQAFIDGIVKAVPTGKQTNSAAQNPPALIMAVARDSGLWSLANAFITPVTGLREDMVQTSAEKLFAHWSQLTSLYGKDGIKYAGYATYLPVDKVEEGVSRETNLGELKRRLTDVIQSNC